MTQEKKAVFFDIDGTLINIMKGQTQIAPAVKKAIRALRAAGNCTFIASGRPYAYLDPELVQQDLFDGYVLRFRAYRFSHAYYPRYGAK